MINVTSLLRAGATLIEVETADPLESCSGHLYFLLDTADDQTGRNLTQALVSVDGTNTVATFDRVDMARVLEGVLMFFPTTTAPLSKTRITSCASLNSHVLSLCSGSRRTGPRLVDHDSGRKRREKAG